MSYGQVAMAEETTYKVESDVQHSAKKKPKKLGFFKNWLLKSVKDAVSEERYINQEKEREALNQISSAKVSRLSLNNSPTPSIDQPERAIQFTIYNANGGRVVETRRYDRQKDRHTTGLYVITSEMDFGREIDKIITMEHLK